MNRLLKYIILFFFLLVVNANAQVCNYCNKKITSKYIAVEGKKFHPNHFLCNYCGKPIQGNFSKQNGKYFHNECYKDNFVMKCDYCGKPINDTYVQTLDGRFHESCFTNNVVEKCAVCNKPLVGEYLVDVYGEKYHKEHKEVLPTCDNCNRIISDRTTEGGVKLEDERTICQLCFDKRIRSSNRYNDLLNKAVYNLSLIGLKIEKSGISIQPVNRDKLLKVSNNSANMNTKGFCQSSYKIREMNGIKKRISETYKIYVLDRLPQESTEGIIVHELMHVWIHQNNVKNLPSNILEGACNYMSYLYMKNRTDGASQQVVLLLENDPDPNYGDGFRKIRSRFDNKSLKEFLQYLKNY